MAYRADNSSKKSTPYAPEHRPNVPIDQSVVNENIITSAEKERTLPDSREVYGSDRAINWMGSSYSGVDLKVIAHLYEGIEDGRFDPARKKLLDDIALNRQLGQAIGTIIGELPNIAVNTNTWVQRADLVRRYASLADSPSADGDHSLKVYRILLGILRGIDFTTPEGIGKGINAYNSLLLDVRMSVGALEEKLKRLDEVAAKGQQTVTLATLQTISVQSHREKFPVRALGHSYVKAYTRGPRTIAGSMIFTLFDENAFSQLIRAMSATSRFKENTEFSSLLPDQLPPIDITLAFANEYGSLSQLGIYGVEFMNDGTTYSIEDLLSENIVNFVARDVDILTKSGNVRLSKLSRGVTGESIQIDSASKLITGNDVYQEYLHTLGVRRRLTNR